MDSAQFAKSPIDGQQVITEVALIQIDSVLFVDIN